jgi:hypothetical protein
MQSTSRFACLSVAFIAAVVVVAVAVVELICSALDVKLTKAIAS